MSSVFCWWATEAYNGGDQDYWCGNPDCEHCPLEIGLQEDKK